MNTSTLEISLALILVILITAHRYRRSDWYEKTFKIINVVLFNILETFGEVFFETRHTTSHRPTLKYDKKIPKVKVQRVHNTKASPTPLLKYIIKKRRPAFNKPNE